MSWLVRWLNFRKILSFAPYRENVPNHYPEQTDTQWEFFFNIQSIFANWAYRSNKFWGILGYFWLHVVIFAQILSLFIPSQWFRITKPFFLHKVSYILQNGGTLRCQIHAIWSYKEQSYKEPALRFWTNVVGISIEKLFDMWRNYEILKYYVICAAVSALSWLSQFCTSKNRFRENS